jgi:AraC family transcriptional regulator
MINLISLDRGHYLGKVVDLCYFDGIIAGATKYSKEAMTSQMHYHDNMHMSFVLLGGSIEKRMGYEFERLPGDIMFYHAGEPHRNIQKVFPSKNINLEVENDFLKRHGITEEAINRAITHNPDGKFLMLKVYKELAENDHFSVSTVHMLFLDLVSQSEKTGWSSSFPTWIKIIHELLNDQWNEKLSLTDLAKAANVNPITISKHFHKYYSSTLGEYMRKLKIERSLSLIKAKETSLTEIAYTCNFADQSHFIRTFKQLTGFLPKRYQKLQEC